MHSGQYGHLQRVKSFKENRLPLRVTEGWCSIMRVSLEGNLVKLNKWTNNWTNCYCFVCFTGYWRVPMGVLSADSWSCLSLLLLNLLTQTQRWHWCVHTTLAWWVSRTQPHKGHESARQTERATQDMKTAVQPRQQKHPTGIVI